MSETRVVNKYLNDISYKDCVGVVCKSKSSGDFKIVKYNDAKDVEIQFLKTGYEATAQLLKDLHELKGKTLGCFCKPKSCHGDILVELVNELGRMIMKNVITDNYKLLHGDCLDRMKDIESGSVDLILTDPPLYNIARDNNFHTMGRKGIDFGEWDKGFDLLSQIDLLPRVCTKNANVVIFNSWTNLGEIAKYAESKGFVVKDYPKGDNSNYVLGEYLQQKLIYKE